MSEVGSQSADREVIPGRRGRKRLLVVLGVLLGLLLVAAAGASYAGYQYAEKYDGRILPGSTIAGADVGGMTETEAIEAVDAAIGPELDRPIAVTWRKKTWTVTPREIGARSNALAAVRSALAVSADTSFAEKTRMRMLGEPLDFERDVAITYPHQGATGFVQGIASSIDKDAVDAGIDYSSGWVEFSKAKPGFATDVKKSKKGLMQALKNGNATVDLVVDKVEPATTADDFRQVLLVRIGENKLYLYQDGKITHDWPVAPGQPQYPTPTGIFSVELKRYMPTWVNPAIDRWGANLPASIPPGPNNPLGVRAINWTAPAIRFHGTSALYSLGYNASHGCVRMSNADVIELYDLIDVGATIVSTQVAPFKPLYGTTTAVDAETTQASG